MLFVLGSIIATTNSIRGIILHALYLDYRHPASMGIAITLLVVPAAPTMC